MFGYVVANFEDLDETQRRRYRACYCGLCRAIGQECSTLCRLSLNYDMTFLALLLSSLYEPEETTGRGRCLPHPLAARDYFYSDCTRYCAAMNVALAYYNCRDDWDDDRNLWKLAQSGLFRGPHRAIARDYPRQTGAIVQCLAELSALERSGVPDPDGAANCFGRLLGELFVMKEDDRWAPLLRQVGEGLGRYVYILDAVMDLEEDLRRGRYNPLSAMADRTALDFRDFLTMLIGECTDAFERLPLVQDAALLRNILYSGVWLKYVRMLQRQKQEVPHDFRSV